MANDCSLAWAEEILDEIEKRYEEYEKEAEARQTTICSIAGQENLNWLLFELDDLLDATGDCPIRNQKANVIYHSALQLYYIISSLVYV